MINAVLDRTFGVSIYLVHRSMTTEDKLHFKQRSFNQGIAQKSLRLPEGLQSQRNISLRIHLQKNTNKQNLFTKY
jgi:hypothetical protein